MANFQTAPKLRIVNSVEQFNIVKMSQKANGAYEPADGIDAPAVLADTDLLKVEGFADLVRGKVVEGVSTLSIPSQKQVSTLTVSGTALTAGKAFTVEAIIKTFNLEHEFVSFDGKNQKSRFYNHVILPGDTLTTIAERIAKGFNLDGEKDGYVFATATSAVDVVTVTAKEPGWELSFKFDGEAITDGNIAIAFAETQPAYEGRNVYRQMNVKRLENPNRTYAYSAGHYGAANEVPSKDGKYSSVILTFEVERADLSGSEMQNSGPVKGEYGIEVYFLEGSPEVVAARDELIAWAKTTAKTFKEYTTTTPAGALAEETPVVTTNA